MSYAFWMGLASREARSLSFCYPTTTSISYNTRLTIDLCQLAADPGEPQSADVLESVERAEPLKRRDGEP